MLSLDDRQLGWLLGLGDLAGRIVCHGYANACVCGDCEERGRLQSEPRAPARQPWETAA